MSLGSWIDDLLSYNQEAIDAVARLIVATHQASGLVYTAGSGHSLALVLETYFRAGGLAIVRPLFHEELLPFNGAQRATRAERSLGIGAKLIAAAAPSSCDTVVIFSQSGRNPYPVEVAQGASRLGAQVVACTSVTASRSSAPRGTARLYEVADVVLDTCTPLGDISQPEQAPVTSPLSTLAGCALWSRVLAVAVTIDASLPLWRSANRDGNDEFNAALAQQLRGKIPQL